jgi:DNA modification methylase
MSRFYLYKKNRRDYIPVEDLELNSQAKKILNDILNNKTKFVVPERYKTSKNNLALFSSTGKIEKISSLYIINEQTTYDLSNKLNDLTSKEWLPETITVFSQKGLGAGSKDAQIEKLHPAPFSFQDVARLIKFFTKHGDTILDPFNGVASTLKACAYENRNGIGIELSKKYCELSKQRIETEVPDDLPFKNNQKLINGNSLKEIKKIKSKSVDLIITSPPYWNILDTVDHKVKQTRISNNLDSKYSEELEDLANIDDYNIFLSTLAKFFHDCGNVLKDDKHLVIIVSDFRKKEKYYVFHADLVNAIESLGNFKLKGIKILYQRHKSIFPYGYPYSFVPNMHHQNVLIFQKKKEV